jgi:hypothetical protein
LRQQHQDVLAKMTQQNSIEIIHIDDAFKKFSLSRNCGASNRISSAFVIPDGGADLESIP